jgi:hypothetical protein
MTASCSEGQRPERWEATARIVSDAMSATLLVLGGSLEERTPFSVVARTLHPTTTPTTATSPAATASIPATEASSPQKEDSTRPLSLLSPPA